MAAVSNSSLMIPDPKDPSSYPIPPDLIKELPDQRTPWNFGDELFKHIQSQPFDAKNRYKQHKVDSQMPEYTFVLRYFMHQKPHNRHIKEVVAIHNPDQTKAFEVYLKKAEIDADTFKPEWKNEDDADQRALVIKRWETITAQFSPIHIKDKRTEILNKVRVIPVIHGTSEPICESICRGGYTYFGKHHYFNPKEAKKGKFSSTDIGYYGSGIYFTDSAKYSHMYSGDKGILMLAWIAMREQPYPIFSEVAHPQKCNDMKKLEGKPAYQAYDAHFIPVELAIKGSMEYYPCMKGQKPVWDEYVVFNPAQALPRFYIKVGIDLPKHVQPKIDPASIPVVQKKIPVFDDLQPGLNLLGICKNPTCAASEKKVTKKLGFGDFNIAKETVDFGCPSCQKTVKNLQSIVLYNCKFSIEGRDDKAYEIKHKDQTQKEFSQNVDNWKYAYVKAEKYPK